MGSILALMGRGLDKRKDKLFYHLVDKAIDGMSRDVIVEHTYKGLDNLCDYLDEHPEINIVFAMGLDVVTAVTGEDTLKKPRASKSMTDYAIDTGKRKVFVRASTTPMYALSQGDYSMKLFAEDLYLAYVWSLGSPVNTMTRAKLVTSVAEVEQLISYCADTGDCAFDYETTGLKHYVDPNFRVTTLSISYQHGTGWVIPFYPPNATEAVFDQRGIREIVKLLDTKLFGNRAIDKIAHNAKFDAHCSAWLGIRSWRGKLHDTIMMHHLLDENKKHGLKELTNYYYQEFRGYEQALGGNFKNADLHTLATYNAVDSDITLRFHTWFTHKLLEEPSLYMVHRNLLSACVHPFFIMERDGFKVDKAFIRNAIQEAEQIQERMKQKLLNLQVVQDYKIKHEEHLRKERIKVLKAEIKQHVPSNGTALSLDFGSGSSSAYVQQRQAEINNIRAGKVNLFTKFSPSSNDDIKEFIYSKHGLNKAIPTDRKTKEKKKKADEETLKTFDDDTGFVEALLNYRAVVKTKGTYLVGLLKHVDKYGFIHTVYNLVGTVTGRISSSDPNFQNIPRGTMLKDEDIRRLVAMVKQAFIPQVEDNSLSQVDYSQAELRLAAHFADEDTMIGIYSRGEDMHYATSKWIMKVTDEEWEAMSKYDRKEYRTAGKSANFGLLYGQKPFGFKIYSKNTFGIDFTDEQSKEYHKSFFQLYGKLSAWHEHQKKTCKKDGFVLTYFGTKRRLNKIYASDKKVRESAERQAINTPNQGTGGQITLFAIAIVANRIDPRVKIVNTVHDSIIFDIPNDLVETELPIIVHTMENLPYKEYFNLPELKVGMKVDVELSQKNWATLEEIEVEKFVCS